IRCFHMTGVQTCALPIFGCRGSPASPDTFYDPQEALRRTPNCTFCDTGAVRDSPNTLRRGFPLRFFCTDGRLPSRTLSANLTASPYPTPSFLLISEMRSPFMSQL